MNSKDYWKKREAANLVSNLKQEKEYERELERIYRDMLDGAQKEIESFYARYAAKEGITIAEARKAVSQLDIEAYERKAKRYVRDKDMSKIANEEMRLYNLTMKVNRLEMLKANIGLEMIKGHAELETFMGKILRGRTEAELKRQAGILGKSVRNNARLANSIVNASFKNATFSQRVWMYHGQMKADVGKLLENGLIQGKGVRQLTKELEKYYTGDKTLKNGRDGAQFAAERLMRTELARVQTDAQKQSFELNGFGQYTFIVNGGCCPICEEVAKKNNGHYEVKDMMPGDNAPPMHPFCRCSVAAYEDSDEYEAWLDFLDKGHTTEAWNKLSNAKRRQLIEEQKRIRLEKEKPFDITKDGKFTQLSISDKAEYKKYIEQEFATQNMLAKELRQLWDKALGYIQNSQGYQDINNYLRGLKAKLDNPQRKLTINLMERLTKNNTLKRDYIGVRKVDSSYLENVLGLNVSGLFKMSLQKNAFGRKQPVKIPKDKAAAEAIADQIRQLIGTSKGTIPDKAFTSVSLSDKLNYFTHFPIKFEIQMPAGTKGVITDNLPESEFITKKGSSIEIIGAEVYNDGEKYCVKILARLLQ